ncbi:MAG TPA: ABC transporter permease [Acidimicrobiales bacterium]
MLATATATAAANAAENPVVPAGRYRAAGVLRSEWTKFRSIRSTTLTIAALLGVTILIGALTSVSEASSWASLSPARRAGFDPTSFSLNGLLFGQLAVGVLGALVMSSEYATGMIRSTLAAVPNRRLVLGAKAAVLAAVVLVVGEVVSFSSFFLGQAILSGSAPSAGIGDPGVLQAVVGGGLYLGVLALLGLGIATIVRHTAGAISSFVGIVLIAPLIVQALPSSVGDTVGKYLPVNIGHALTSVQTPAHDFSPWVGLGLLCAYAATAMAVGAWLMVRRDA